MTAVSGLLLTGGEKTLKQTTHTQKERIEEKMLKKFVKTLSFLMVPLILFSACSGTADSGKKDTLTVAYASEATNLDPHNNVSLTSMSLEMMIYDRLVERTADGEIVPSLATGWEELDETTVRFYLRDDVKFHNGEKLTAEDVKYTIERASTMPNSATFFAYFDGEGTTVIDEYTIDIKLTAPFAPIYNYLATARGSIVCKKTMEEIGSDSYGRTPVGSGKFKFTNWVSGDRVELTRNDDYWGEKPAYQEFVARTIVESANRAIEVETGGVDIAMAIDPSDTQRLIDNPDTEIVSGPSYTISMLVLYAAKHEEISDVRVREALSIAIDVPALVNVIYKGTATVADSVMNSQILYYKPVGPLQYDPERARELLEEANFDFSKPIKITVNSSGQSKDIAEIIQNQWGAIGVTTEIDMVDGAKFNEMYSSGEMMIFHAASSASSGDPDHALTLWCRGPLQYLCTDESILDLTATGKQTYDTAERQKIYEELQQKCWDYHGVIPLAYVDAVYATRSEVENVVVSAGGTPDFSTVTFAAS